jgi:predicted ATPase
VLDAFPAGVWLVELAHQGEPELVVPTVAQVLGLREVPGAPLIYPLCSYLKNKRALLILDNCEHLLNACAELAGKLLQSGPEVRLLTSSRKILNV